MHYVIIGASFFDCFFNCLSSKLCPAKVMLFTIVVISNCYLKCEPDSLCSGYSYWVSIPGPEKLIKARHHYHLPGFALFVVVCNFGLIFVSVNFLLV